MRYFWLFLLIPSLCWAQTIDLETARGTIKVKKGDTLAQNSKWKGQVIGLEDVTFRNWNFVRKTPHTEIFVNCKNLTFVQCNLTNVEIPKDATVIDSLTIHVEEKKVGNKLHRIVECGDGKTRTYLIEKEDFDVVEHDLKEMGMSTLAISNVKQSVANEYTKKNKEVLIKDGKINKTLIDTKPTFSIRNP